MPNWEFCAKKLDWRREGGGTVGKISVKSARLEHERLSQVDEEQNFNYRLKKSSLTRICTRDLPLHSLPLYHLCYLTTYILLGGVGGEGV